MSVPGAAVLLMLGLTGLLATLVCAALLWLAGRFSGQPTFRQTLLGAGKLALVLAIPGVACLAGRVLLAGQLP